MRGEAPDRVGKGGEFGFEERDTHAGGQMKDRAARGGMDKADEIAPLVAVLHGSEGTLPVETPDLVQDRLEPDAVFVDRPELDLRVREGGRDLAEERAELFLKASCAAGSACTWRGRGLRRLPSRRTR